jgi:hypothetical protein
MLQWRIGSTARSLPNDVCSASKLALPVRSVIMTFNDRQISTQQRLAMTDSIQIAAQKKLTMSLGCVTANPDSGNASNLQSCERRGSLQFGLSEHIRVKD